MADCAGSHYPPDPYRCKSRSTKIINSIETTLFGCQCCSRIYRCDEEICNGGKELRCQSELLKGCYCIDSQAEPLVAVMPELNFYPNAVTLGLIIDRTQGRSKTPTEPPPTTSLEEAYRTPPTPHTQTLKTHYHPQRHFLYVLELRECR